MPKPDSNRPQESPTLDLDRATFEAVVKKANGGDQAALGELRRILDDNPLLWRRFGDLQGHAERAWIALASEGDVAVSESIRRDLARMKRELGGEAPAAVERILVDQVASVFLELKYLEELCARVEGGTLGQEALRLKRLESAQRRYHAALKHLMLIRKLIPQGDVEAGLRVLGERKQA